MKNANFIMMGHGGMFWDENGNTFGPVFMATKKSFQKDVRKYVRENNINVLNRNQFFWMKKITDIKMENFKRGDILLLTYNHRNESEIRAAIVVGINYNCNHHVTYNGYTKTGFPVSGMGAFNPDEIYGPYGLIKVERIGHIPPAFDNRWSPKPGDVHYDLMC